MDQTKVILKHYWDATELVEQIESAIGTNGEMEPGIGGVWDDYASINSLLEQALDHAVAVQRRFAQLKKEEEAK